MMKRKVIFCITLTLLALAFVPIQPVKAANSWWVYWHEYVNYYQSPVNISTTMTVSGANGHCTVVVGLVVTVYWYIYDYPVNMDFVYFGVTVYVKSVADPGYQPQYAQDVSIRLRKQYDDQEHTKILMITDADPPGYSQGHGLGQTTTIPSDYDQRAWWALKALGFAVGLAYEPVGIAIGLIDIATSWVPSSGDFQNAGYYDTSAYSWWHNPGYLEEESPVRQYCFNCFRWWQDNTPPYATYGLEITATITPLNTHVIPAFTTAPIYLRICYGGNGGAGCPYVSTWNGNRYVLDNNILPAAEMSNGADVEDYYRLEQLLVPTYEGKLFSFYSLQISEFEHEHSYLDHVKLLAADHPPDVKVAVSPYGEILTYSNPAPPITAVDEDGINILSLLNSMDESYYQGCNGSHITLTFAPTDITNGIKLVIRADEKPPVLKCPVYVQVINATGDWNTVATFHTRTHWATDIINMIGYLPDPEGNLKVRLCFVSNDKIDYVGLDTAPQASIETYEANLISAFHSAQGNVKPLLMENDQTYAELIPGEQIKLTFLLPNNQNQKRTFIFYTKGHYNTIDN